ncbi:hypothetical protein TSAR_009074 [Trichomalopsis sarcophagae]|uniref:Uncharacterized protein n=1 Tax=Trichomalopsis sarcophagae TaxID=543379 RepID=A0A232FGE6_9HYME|nr:hypothetical protein TSAR_009074 [Trichomalopsis sarcophagae]
MSRALVLGVLGLAEHEYHDGNRGAWYPGWTVSTSFSRSKLVTRGFLGLLNTNIAKAIASEVPGAQGGQYERRLLQFYKIVTQLVKTRYSGVFRVAEHEYRDGAAMAYKVPAVQGGQYERHFQEFHGNCCKLVETGVTYHSVVYEAFTIEFGTTSEFTNSLHMQRCKLQLHVPLSICYYT